MSLLWNRRFFKPTTNPSCLCTGTGVFKTYDESFMSLLWNRRFKTYDESFMSLLWNRPFFKTYDESFMSLLWNRRF